MNICGNCGRIPIQMRDIYGNRETPFQSSPHICQFCGAREIRPFLRPAMDAVKRELLAHASLDLPAEVVRRNLEEM